MLNAVLAMEYSRLRTDEHFTAIVYAMISALDLWGDVPPSPDFADDPGFCERVEDGVQILEAAQLVMTFMKLTDNGGRRRVLEELFQLTAPSDRN